VHNNVFVVCPIAALLSLVFWAHCCRSASIAHVHFRLQLIEYVIIGRKLPSKEQPKPSLFKMTIYAPNVVVAKSRYWYFLSQLHKVKKMAGEIVSIKEVHPGIVLYRFHLRTC
jgi:hypothetical protein